MSFVQTCLHLHLHFFKKIRNSKIALKRRNETLDTWVECCVQIAAIINVSVLEGDIYWTQHNQLKLSYAMLLLTHPVIRYQDGESVLLLGQKRDLII